MGEERWGADSAGEVPPPSIFASPRPIPPLHRNSTISTLPTSFLLHDPGALAAVSSLITIIVF